MTFQSFFMLMTNQPSFFASSWSFDDPAKATGSEEEVFAVFRRVRDEIGKFFGAYAAGHQAVGVEILNLSERLGT